MEIQYFEFLKHLIRFNQYAYLDHNATTYVSSRVRRKMNQVLKDHYGNPSSFYGIGRKSAEIMEQARQDVATAIHADPHEVYFTACATESNNAVLKSVSAHFFPKKTKSIPLCSIHWNTCKHRALSSNIVLWIARAACFWMSWSSRWMSRPS